LFEEVEKFKDKGDMYYRQYKFESSVNAYEECLECLDQLQDTPESGEIRLYVLASLVEATSQLGYHEQAVYYGEMALQVGELSRVYHLVGKAFVALEDMIQAKQYVGVAFELEPGN
jgi:tetratricopeptide (TPR) repeat protein